MAYTIVDDAGNETYDISNAIIEGDVDGVKAYLVDAKEGKCSNLINWRDRVDKYSPLCLAAKHGEVEIMKLLVEAGHNINKPSGNRGWTPLHVACYESWERVVRYLLDESEDIARYPRGDDHGVTALHLSVEQGFTNGVRYLLGRNFPVDVTDNFGRTSLAYVNKFDKSIIRNLMHYGASLDKVDAHVKDTILRALDILRVVANPICFQITLATLILFSSALCVSSTLGFISSRSTMCSFYSAFTMASSMASMFFYILHNVVEDSSHPLSNKMVTDTTTLRLVSTYVAMGVGGTLMMILRF